MEFDHGGRELLDEEMLIFVLASLWNFITGWT